jgi:hypothetical protein
MMEATLNVVQSSLTKVSTNLLMHVNLQETFFLPLLSTSASSISHTPHSIWIRICRLLFVRRLNPSVHQGDPSEIDATGDHVQIVAFQFKSILVTLMRCFDSMPSSSSAALSSALIEELHSCFDPQLMVCISFFESLFMMELLFSTLITPISSCSHICTY